MPRPVSCLLILIAIVGMVGAGLIAQPSRSAAVADRPFGLKPGTSWTTSRVAGAPEPPDPYVIRPAFTGVKFDRPLHLESAPIGNRWYVGQELATIRSIAIDAKSGAKSELFLDARVRDRTNPKWADMRRLWSFTFHPKYADNGFVFVCVIQYGSPNVNKILRYTVAPEARAATVPTCDPATETLICEWPCGVDHFGGCLVFGADGMLYFSAGDGHGYGDGNETGQDLSDLNASILRIDADHPPAGRMYGIPKDNPFVDLAGARPEIWAYGLRNVWKFSIDHPTGHLWAGDVGQDLWEPVVLVRRGGNYGWSVTEGSHPFRPNRKRGPTPIEKPVWEHEHSEARSLTGGYVYRGKRFPELVGKYVYGDYDTGKVWALTWDGEKADVRQILDMPIKLVAFGRRGDGELALLDYQGTIHDLARNPAAAADAPKPPPFPRKLSETGLFASTKDHTPATGVIPYDVNSPLWSDGAHKQRYLALPPGGKIRYAKDGAWGFPDGSVLVKTFELEMTKGDPSTRRRLETRLLHIEQDHWRGYTYLWNDEQADAELLDDPRGADRAFEIKDASSPGGIRKQVWHFPSRAECTLCHTMPAGFVLGLTTRQMNRDHTYAGGVADNQLRAMENALLFDKPVLARHGVTPDRWDDPKVWNELPRLPNPTGSVGSVNDRARSYLDANCSHCHRRWGGGNALFELQWDLPLEKTMTLNVPAQHGEHGVPDGRIIAPGDPARSLLLGRMKSLDATRMPRAGSNVVDEAGVKLIEQWIREMR